LSMPRFSRAVALIGLLLLAQAAAAERLRLVADAWPPFTDATLVNGGLATDIVTTALARAGYASEVEQVPWARALMGVGDGRYDVFVNAWYDEARTQLGQFYGENLLNRLLFLKRRDDPIDYQNLEQLHDYPVAVVRGYAYSAAFDADPQLQVPTAAEVFPADELAKAKAEWERRLNACPAEHRPYLVLQYATPVRNQYRVKAGIAL